MMKVLAALAFLALAAANVHDRAFYEEKFFEWMQVHKVEVKSGSHFVHMLQNFANNHDQIEAHNGGNHSYTLGHNKFSHMNSEEWREYVNKSGLMRPPADSPLDTVTAPADPSTLQGSVDWVAAGRVSGVKDQGSCGSCWSFSTTGALEGAFRIKFNDYYASFSEQHLVDCDHIDNGCNGGWMDNAFSWIQSNGWICNESEYPYNAVAQRCDTSRCSPNKNTAPRGHSDVAVNDQGAMEAALNGQPVAVAVDASGFQFYSGGIFSGPCTTTNLNHGVLAVGYTGDSWKVKNSWGTGWGEGGYIRMAKGNTCGILAAPSFPVM
jgi:KDEL-tailed cysteine endopeptidase